MLLMDLGGWTVDFMRIDNAIPVADTAHSLELGMIRCVDDIQEQVRRETGLSLTDAQIENMLAGQPCTVSEAVRDTVNKQGRKYTEHLLSATMEAGFDLHAMEIVKNERNKNAAQYFRPQTTQRDEFYNFFFKVCRKYNIDWATATPKERAFAEEVTRVTYEHHVAATEGRSLATVRAAFEA